MLFPSTQVSLEQNPISDFAVSRDLQSTDVQEHSMQSITELLENKFCTRNQKTTPSKNSSKVSKYIHSDILASEA